MSPCYAGLRSCLRQFTEAYDEFHTKLREGGLEFWRGFLHTWKSGYSMSIVCLTAPVRCLRCLRSTLPGSTADTVHAPVALAVSCSVSVPLEEYTNFYCSTVDTVLSSVHGGFAILHRFSA